MNAIHMEGDKKMSMMPKHEKKTNGKKMLHSKPKFM
jgi:hypothetical protein